jgi:hypothetical protein
MHAPAAGTAKTGPAERNQHNAAGDQPLRIGPATRAERTIRSSVLMGHRQQPSRSRPVVDKLGDRAGRLAGGARRGILVDDEPDEFAARDPLIILPTVEDAP